VEPAREGDGEKGGGLMRPHWTVQLMEALVSRGREGQDGKHGETVVAGCRLREKGGRERLGAK